MIDIAVETPAQAGDREALLDRVMGPARFSKPSQVLRTGRRPADGLSFVATNGGAVVGTVRLWDVRLGDDCPALLLGPLAVDRSVQDRGIGSALMEVALDRAESLGHEAVILVGEPTYYRRFGSRGTSRPACGCRSIRTAGSYWAWSSSAAASPARAGLSVPRSRFRRMRAPHGSPRRHPALRLRCASPLEHER
jgi:predicted N-acetyltransferase YhbS